MFSRLDPKDLIITTIIIEAIPVDQHP